MSMNGIMLWTSACIIVMTSFDCESKVARGAVTVPRNNVPHYPVNAGRQLRQTDLKKSRVGRINAAISFVYHLVVCIVDHNRRKGRLQIAIEPDTDLGRRNSHSRAHLRVGMIRERMPPRYSRQGQQRSAKEKSACHNSRSRESSEFFHGKIGLPMLFGKRSSMKEMHETEDPDIFSCARVDRDLRSNAQLHILAAPDNPGVDRSGCISLAVRGPCRSPSETRSPGPCA